MGRQAKLRKQRKNTKKSLKNQNKEPRLNIQKSKMKQSLKNKKDVEVRLTYEKQKIKQLFENPERLEESLKYICFSYYLSLENEIKDIAKDLTEQMGRGYIIGDITLFVKYLLGLLGEDIKLFKSELLDCLGSESYQELYNDWYGKKKSQAIIQTFKLLDNYNPNDEVCAFFVINEIPEFNFQGIVVICLIDLVDSNKIFKKMLFISS